MYHFPSVETREKMQKQPTLRTICIISGSRYSAYSIFTAPTSSRQRCPPHPPKQGRFVAAQIGFQNAKQFHDTACTETYGIV